MFSALLLALSSVLVCLIVESVDETGVVEGEKGFVGISEKVGDVEETVVSLFVFVS